jgi:hypothetical protein
MGTLIFQFSSSYLVPWNYKSFELSNLARTWIKPLCLKLDLFIFFFNKTKTEQFISSSREISTIKLIPICTFPRVLCQDYLLVFLLVEQTEKSGGELLELRLLDTHLLDTFGSKSIARHKFYHLLESS